MEKLLKKFDDVTDHGHCIIKEELMIADSDEEIDVEKVDKEIYSTLKNSKRSDSQTDFGKRDKSNGTPTKRKRGRPGTKIHSADDKKRKQQHLLVKSENVESRKALSNDKQYNDSMSSKRNEIPISDIDNLAKKLAISYCKNCRKKSEVIRNKNRCSNCKTTFSYVCHRCDKTYSSITALNYHLKMNHTNINESHTCSVCSRKFARRKSFIQHRVIKHQIYESLNCSMCDKKFSRSSNRAMHEKYCIGGQRIYKCDFCSYTSTYKVAMANHLAGMHSGFKEKCRNCLKVFTHPRSFQIHTRIFCNDSRKMLECDHCGYKVRRKDQLVEHIDKFHLVEYKPNDANAVVTTRRKICQYCGLILAPHERMKYHRIRCRAEPFKKELRICNYCNEAMKPSEHIRYHVERCESAPLSLRDPNERAKLPDIDSALKELAVTHCVECRTTEPLKNRLRLCGKCNKPWTYACAICPRKFAVFSRLRVHLQQKHVRTLKFYRCDKCRCYYDREKSLIKHQRDVHSNNQSLNDYKCDKCGKEYNNRVAVRKHEILCGREPRFHCDKCPYKTYFKNSIVRHIWSKRGKCV